MQKSLGERIKRRMAVGEFRSVVSLAKSFRARRSDVEGCIHDVCGLDLIVGVRAGNGVGDLHKSEWQIERFE